MHQRLFCKPTDTKKVFSKNNIQFRSLDLGTDISLIHDWVTQPYTHRFWQLNVSREKVYALYKNILRDPDGHSFIGLWDHQPICQVDVYRVMADEVHNHIPDAMENDCGMHLLMAPAKYPVTGLTRSVLTTFLHFYFSFPGAQIMYGEPDIENDKANQLVKSCGFTFLKNIPMSYKTANLYSITKQQFQQQ